MKSFRCVAGTKRCKAIWSEDENGDIHKTTPDQKCFGQTLTCADKEILLLHGHLEEIEPCE